MLYLYIALLDNGFICARTDGRTMRRDIVANEAANTACEQYLFLSEKEDGLAESPTEWSWRDDGKRDDGVWHKRVDDASQWGSLQSQEEQAHDRWHGNRWPDGRPGKVHHRWYEPSPQSYYAVLLEFNIKNKKFIRIGHAHPHTQAKTLN